MYEQIKKRKVINNNVIQGYFQHGGKKYEGADKEGFKKNVDANKDRNLLRRNSVKDEEFDQVFDAMYDDTENGYVFTSFKSITKKIIDYIISRRMPPQPVQQEGWGIDTYLPWGIGGGEDETAEFDYESFGQSSQHIVSDIKFRAPKMKVYNIKIGEHKFTYTTTNAFIMGMVGEHSYDDLFKQIKTSKELLNHLYVMFTHNTYVSDNPYVSKLYIIIMMAEAIGRSSHNAVTFYIVLQQYIKSDSMNFEEFYEQFQKLSFSSTGGSKQSQAYKTEEFSPTDAHELEATLIKGFEVTSGYKGKTLIGDTFVQLLKNFHSKVTITEQ